MRAIHSVTLFGLVALCSACSDTESAGAAAGAGGGSGGLAGSGGAGGSAGASAECEGVGAAAGVPPPIQWSGCSPVSATAPMAECGTLDVPVSYTDPSAGSYALELMRIPAAKPAEKTGTVLFNLGGPGVSATDYIAHRGIILQASPLGQVKDIVGMNIRGASADTAPKWMTTAIVESLRSVDRTPDDDADWQALDVVYADLVKVALADTLASKLATLGTRDTVRDMVRLTVALGEQRLDFLGMSYGTLTGALFASECPSRTGNLVFDSALVPKPDFFTGRIPMALRVEKELKRQADLCSKDPACPFHGGASTEEVLAARRALAAQLEASGGVAVGERKLFESDLHHATYRALVRGEGKKLWAELAAAEQGDWQPLLARADTNWGREAGGSYSTNIDRYWSIALNDTSCPESWSLDAAKAAVAAVAKDAPELGAVLVTDNALICLHWPAVGTQLPVRKTSAPPQLIIGGVYDLITPVEYAPALAALLDNGSFVVTHDQPVHVAWLSNDCITAMTIDFLLNGKQPAVTHCDAE